MTIILCVTLNFFIFLLIWIWLTTDWLFDLILDSKIDLYLSRHVSGANKSNNDLIVSLYNIVSFALKVSKFFYLGRKKFLAWKIQQNKHLNTLKCFCIWYRFPTIKHPKYKYKVLISFSIAQQSPTVWQFWVISIISISLIATAIRWWIVSNDNFRIL